METDTTADEESFDLYLDEFKKYLQDKWLICRTPRTARIILISSFLSFSLEDAVRGSFSATKYFVFILALYCLMGLALTSERARNIIRVSLHYTVPKFASVQFVMSAIQTEFRAKGKKAVLNFCEITLKSLRPAFMIFSLLFTFRTLWSSNVTPLVTGVVLFIVTTNFISKCLPTASTSGNFTKTDVKPLCSCQLPTENANYERRPEGENKVHQHREARTECYVKEVKPHEDDEPETEYCCNDDHSKQEGPEEFAWASTEENQVHQHQEDGREYYQKANKFHQSQEPAMESGCPKGHCEQEEPEESSSALTKKENGIHQQQEATKECCMKENNIHKSQEPAVESSCPVGHGEQEGPEESSSALTKKENGIHQQQEATKECCIKENDIHKIQEPAVESSCRIGHVEQEGPEELTWAWCRKKTISIKTNMLEKETLERYNNQGEGVVPCSAEQKGPEQWATQTVMVNELCQKKLDPGLNISKHVN